MPSHAFLRAFVAGLLVACGGTEAPPASAGPVETEAAEARAEEGPAIEVSDDVERMVALGMGRRAILELRTAHVAQEWVEEPEPRLVERELLPDEREAVVAEVDAALAAHFEAQEEWPSPTDPERLVRAFAALGADGILARHAYGMHEPDGLSLLQEEAEGADPRGYVFYDQQMLEEVLAGRLRLSWGGFANGEVAPGTTELGETIASALRGEGLHVDWDGSVDSYIELSPLGWHVKRDPATGEPLVSLRSEPSSAE